MPPKAAESRSCAEYLLSAPLALGAHPPIHPLGCATAGCPSWALGVVASFSSALTSSFVRLVPGDCALQKHPPGAVFPEVGVGNPWLAVAEPRAGCVPLAHALCWCRALQPRRQLSLSPSRRCFSLPGCSQACLGSSSIASEPEESSLSLASRQEEFSGGLCMGLRWEGAECCCRGAWMGS